MGSIHIWCPLDEVLSDTFQVGSSGDRHGGGTVQQLKEEWKENAEQAGLGDVKMTQERDLQGIGSQKITDDIKLSTRDAEQLRLYTAMVMQVLRKYRVTVSLRKCRSQCHCGNADPTIHGRIGGIQYQKKEQDEELKNENENEIPDEIKGQPTLARPEWSRRFYLKQDWRSMRKSEVLLQANLEDDDARKAEMKENVGDHAYLKPQ